MKINFNDARILITGGTGSFGKRYIKNLLAEYPNIKRLVIFSRDELKQYNMSNRFNEKDYPGIRYFLGDIRDLGRLRMALKGIDYVFHAAALKHVPLCEYNPFEAVKTNIIGSQNVIEASINENVKKVIALSTDKAAAPTSLYGATKLTSDKLFISANNYTGKNDIKFSVVRYGNVFGSRGSVVPTFLKLKSSGFLPITDKKMTRFNITLSQGVNFVLKSFDKMWGGEIFVPKIPSYRIMDVAKAIAPTATINIIGVRPGEKIHEEMISKSDSTLCAEFDDHYVILPNMNSPKKLWDYEDYLNNSNPARGELIKDGFSYNSKQNSRFLSIKELKDLVKSLKFQ